MITTLVLVVEFLPLYMIINQIKLFYVAIHAEFIINFIKSWTLALGFDHPYPI